MIAGTGHLLSSLTAVILLVGLINLGGVEPGRTEHLLNSGV
jgi:hypothetical protein